MKIYDNFSLLEHNTFGMNVCAKRFIEYNSEDELHEILPSLRTDDFFHIGGGSNLLFMNDYNGTVIHSGVKGIEVVYEDEKYVEVKVGAGVNWDDFVASTIKNGWYGLENLSYIPGEVGASAVQNIGAYGVEAKDFVKAVEAIEYATGYKHVFGNSDCRYGYRSSIFKSIYKGKFAITYVTYKLNKVFAPNLDYGNIRTVIGKENPTAEEVRNAVIKIRQSKLPDPKEFGNAGSFYMNPIISVEQFEKLKQEYPDMPNYIVTDGVKVPAGWLIEKSGWKGRNVGAAGVHTQQSLVLVNLGNAKGEDIMALSRLICDSVKQMFDIDLHPEVNVIC